MLAAEYSFFKKELKEVQELKEEYNGYVHTLRKIVSQNNADEKKKEISVSPQTANTFITVNRTPHYLKKSALAFGKKQGLGWALRQLYEANDWVSYAQKMGVAEGAAAPAIKKKKTSSKSNLIGKSTPLPKKNRQKLSSAVYGLKKDAVFAWPLAKSSFYMSSQFGPRKKPNGTWGFHYGLDMAAPQGTPIKAAADGVVIEAKKEIKNKKTGFGNTVVIFHNKKFKTRYAHLSEIRTAVGKKVRVGDVIGTVGNTGRVRSGKGGSGHHLHFEVHLFDKAVNPLYFLK